MHERQAEKSADILVKYSWLPNLTRPGFDLFRSQKSKLNFLLKQTLTHSVD